MDIKKFFLAFLSLVLATVTLFSSTATLVAAALEAAGPSAVLQITSSDAKKVNTTKSSYTFTGTSDPSYPLTVNGQAISRMVDGSFTKQVELAVGKNTFVFQNNTQKLTYTVNYQYTLIKSYSHKDGKTYKGGQTFTVTVKARKGSTVTAKFRGKTKKLKAQSGATGTFVTYSGKFTMPKSKSITINYGRIAFTAKNKVTAKTVKSGNILCKASSSQTANYTKKDPNYNLSGGRYINVGKGKIAEVVGYEAETFNAYSTNDWSRPTNNYLPKGTIDYCSNRYVYHTETDPDKKYAVLRCGLQVYTKNYNPTIDKYTKITKVYSGTLPSYNKITAASFKNGTTHTTLTLDTMWRAPFYVKLPQNYVNASAQDYRITKATYTYVDITFCYAAYFNGTITVPKDNPLFRSAKLIKNKSDYTLRLYLKEQGAFYGWLASFNAKGQLIFKFLNPAKIAKASNKYGYDLSGVRIFIDVGHGGKDQGAGGFAKAHTEAYQNLILAKQLRKELESIGATVYMNRTKNVLSTSDEKLKLLRSIKPDYCVAVHHDSSYYASENGFCSYYSQPFSMNAAKYIRNHTSDTKVYKQSKMKWHFYYTARATLCPVVLTENGYMSNWYDYNRIIRSDVNQIKAKAITKGIVQYFQSIQ